MSVMSVRDVVALASASPFDCSGCSGTPEVVHDAEDDAWDCYRTKTMLATYDGVVEAQRDLDELSRPFGGRSDGWGTQGDSADA